MINDMWENIALPVAYQISYLSIFLKAQGYTLF